MGRACLVALFVVGGFCGAAEAKRAAPCECAESRTYPELDAYDVPTNQRAIEIRPWDESEPIKITSLGELTPDTDYHFDNAPFLRFHTAAGPDWHPPSAPVSINASIVVRTSSPDSADQVATQTAIALWGDHGDDARFLEVFLENSAGQKAHFAMAAGNPQLCGQPLHISAGPAKITVWAIDRAGQRSEKPWTGEVNIVAVDDDPTGGECERRHHHFKCGMGTAMLFILVVPVGFIGLLIGLFIVSIIRRSRIRNTPGEPLSPLFGEAVARVVAKGYLIKSAIAVIVAIASLQMRDEELSIMAAVISWPFAFGWLIMLVRTRMIVSRFEAPLNVLERREDWLLVDRKLLYCGRSAFNRASQLPTASATLQRRD
ncbi:MAG TPA: hypothetical protein VMZ53_09470 [Kofleriaceae bacterium]|nr:hypothetical protein [Kofleriaceae bacterium]